MAKIALFWHNYPSENLGVGALTASNIQLIKDNIKDDNLEFVCIGTMPEAMEKLKTLHPNITYIQGSLKRMLNPVYFIKVLKEIRSCDMALDLGEGDSFSDIYGVKRFITQSIPKLMALLLNIPLIFSPQTIGPFNKKFITKLAAFLLNRSAGIFPRDEKSKDAVTAILNNDNIPVIQTSDLAFSLSFDSTKKEVNHVGINISGLLYNGGYTGNNEFGLAGNYQELNENIIVFFKSKNWKVTLLPHVITDRYPIEDDYIVCERLALKYGVLCSPKFTTPSEAKSYISRFSLFIGSRMHATIGAVSAGVPTIPLAYSRKFKGLFDSINYPFVLDLRSDSNEVVMSYIQSSISHEFLEKMEASALLANKQANSSLQVYADFLNSQLDK